MLRFDGRDAFRPVSRLSLERRVKRQLPFRFVAARFAGGPLGGSDNT